MDMDMFSPPSSMSQLDSKTKTEEKVDYSNLPCPKPYEDIHREATMCLKPENFEGFRLSYNKMLNQRFYLSHNVSLGPVEISTQEPVAEVIKTPTRNYEFGVNFIDPKLMLIGRVTADGIVNIRARSELTDKFSVMASGQLSNEEHMNHGAASFDYKGSDYRTHLQIVTGSIFMANYIQHVTPKLSLGGEVFWCGDQRKSAVGYTARYENDKMIASGQVGSNGMVTMSYVQKITQRVSFATEFIYNYITREVSSSVGYDYILRLSRLRAKIDSSGTSAFYLEQALPVGLNILISGEVDQMKKDYKFGIGLNVG